MAGGLAACSSEPRATDWVFGDSLAIKIHEVRKAEEVRYSDEVLDEDGTTREKHYLITPVDGSRQIAALRFEVFNRGAGMILFCIGKEESPPPSFEMVEGETIGQQEGESPPIESIPSCPGSVILRDENSVDYLPIDPLKERREVSQADPADPQENRFVPFIWGNVELPETIQMQEGGELPAHLVGWLLYEVPRDLQIDRVMWEAADSIWLRF